MRFPSRKAAQHHVWVILALLFWVGGVFAIDPEAEAQQARFNARLAVEQQEWALAEQWLERGLMYQPENAEITIDLAHLLAQRGRYRAAMALVKSLLDDPRTPEALLPALQALVNDYQKADDMTANLEAEAIDLAWAAGLTWEIYVGRARNPAARTASSSLQLTTDGGVIELPLTETPRPAWVNGLGVNWAIQPGTELTAYLQQTTPTQTMRQYSLALQHQIGDWRWKFTTLETANLLRRHDLVVAHRQQNQQWSLGVFQEEGFARQGWQTGWRKPLWIFPQSEAHVLLGYEYQTGTPRAGGGHWRIEAFSQWQLQRTVNLTLGYGHQQDLHGYSPLLSNNARRQHGTVKAMLEWAWLRTPTTYMGLQLYAMQRRANLPLFTFRDQGVQWVGRYTWPTAFR